MATLRQGILGGFSGKVGTVIGYTRKGVSYIRGLMTSFTSANTPAQMEQRAKFTLVMKFLRPLGALLRIGFKNVSSTLSGFNLAFSYTMENAVSGLSPDFLINYSKVLVCRGNLPTAMNPVATSAVPATIDFTWEDNSWDFGAKSTDKVILVAYCPSLGKSVSVIGAATRVVGEQTMALPNVFSGQTVQTYIGFCDEGETEFSNGEFLDAVLVA